MRNLMYLAAGLILLEAAAPEPRVAVTLPASLQASGGGRLLLFAAPAHAGEAVLDAVDLDTKGVAVAARDAGPSDLRRGAAIDLDGVAYPKPFSALPAGDYRIQAVLDRNGDYNYAGRGPGDPLGCGTTHLRSLKSFKQLTASGCSFINDAQA